MEVTTTAKVEAKLTAEELGKWDERIDRMVATMTERNYSKGWLGYRMAELKPPFEVWRKVGKLLGFKTGWAYHKHREHTLGIKSPNAEELN